MFCICVRVAAVHDISAHVLQSFLTSQLLFIDVVLVAYVLYRCCMRCNRFRLCCKSLCTRCIRVLDMLQVFHVNVSKLGLNFSMLQILISNAADVEYRCCRHVLLGVANIKF
jgi:hypothetical protein